LTQKDKDFLERLTAAMEETNLYIELRESPLKNLVLRKNYGARLESFFGLSRQGIRWRFRRLFNEIYVNAYVTIFFVESHFGTELRPKALAIAKEQIELRRKAQRRGMHPLQQNVVR